MQAESKLSNLGLEMALIGCWLLDSDSKLPPRIGEIEPEIFYSPAHRAIAFTIKTLHESGVAADLVTVAHSMSQAGTLDGAGGDAYLVQCAESVASLGNAEHYEGQVRELWHRRRMAELGSRLAAVAVEEGAEQKISKIRSEMFEVESRSGSAVVDSQEFDPYNKRNFTGVPTISKLIDDQLDHGGWPCGHVSVVLAGTGAGKSTFMLQSALRVLESFDHNDPFADRCRVLYVSGEMDNVECRSKLLAARVGYFGTPTRLDQKESFDANCAWLRNAPLTIRDLRRAPGGVRDFGDVCSWVRAQHRTEPVGIVFIDYAQMFTLRGVRGQGWEISGMISAMAGGLAADLNIPIVFGSQVSFNVAKMAQTKNGRELEEDAALVIELTRDKEADLTKISLRKIRHGVQSPELVGRWDKTARRLEVSRL